MSCTRKKLVEQAKSWLGCKESNGSHKKIIDVYNSKKPRARGYKLKYTDAWCSGFASACAIACNATDIIPTEVGCQKHIALFKKKGIWVEADDYVPQPADYIFYDWDDSGKGDNKGSADHVGIVEKVADGKIIVIEGNYSNSVKRRTLKVNGKNIRGFGVPKYDAEDMPESEPVEDNAPATTPAETTKPAEIPAPVCKSQKAKDAARYFMKSLAGTYVVTASALNVRNGAGIGKSKMVAIPRGTVVKCYGYYSKAAGVKWLYIQFNYKGVTYTGFASAKYLEN